MFTGIVEEIGRLISISKSHSSAKIKISVSDILSDIKIGDSISCNGVCLTVISFDKKSFEADISYETQNLTTFKNIQQGSLINLERALKLSDRLGGHIVSGHVDTISQILAIKKEDESYKLTIELPEKLSRFIAKKGSIAIEGISLTVADITARYFEVAVIPHTFISTTLHKKTAGDNVNIEVDTIARYLESLFKDKSESDKDKRLLEILKNY